MKQTKASLISITILLVIFLGLSIVRALYFPVNQIEEVETPQSTEQKDGAELIPFSNREVNNPNNYIKIDTILYNRLMDDSDGTGYYLNHNLEGIEDQIGIPYVDFRTDFQTRKTLVYAHSTLNQKGPFQVLQKYHNNPSFFEEHPFIEVRYNDVIYTYQIFSVYISTANSDEDEGLEYFYRMYYTDDSWEQKIQEYKSLSEYDTKVEVSGNDKILILQTCSMDPDYYEKYYRYNLLVYGKLIEKKNSI